MTDVRPTRWRYSAAAALATALVLGAPVAAQAAPYATEATITNIEFTQETVSSGSLAELTGAWELPDNPTGPAGFTIPLPADLFGSPDTIPMLDPDGMQMGLCTVTRTVMDCAVDDAYIASHPLDLHGEFSLWVTVRTVVENETSVDYTFGDFTTSVNVQPGSTPCTTNCEFTGLTANKSGWFVSGEDRGVWRVVVPAPTTGMSEGDSVTVVDTIGANQAIIAGETTVEATNQLGPNASGATRPIAWAPLPADAYTLSADGSTVSFEAQEGFFYRVVYRVDVLDGGAQVRYENSAEVTVEDVSSQVVTGSFIARGGSATGIGTGVGVFTITKDVLGDVQGLDGQTYTGTYIVTTPDGEAIEGTFEVRDGETWRSPEFPMDSVVSLAEDVQDAPVGIAWADPSFSQNDFTLAGGSITAVELVNEASLAMGSFSATKVVDGDAAALVDDETVFMLDYSYPAGDHFPAGEGTLELPADGTLVESPQLPVGAVVTLVERTPAALDGATWAEPVLSTSVVTIGADAEPVTVTVTNTITEVPETPAPSGPGDVSAPPTPDAGTPSSSLPETGMEPLPALLVGMVLVGLGLVAARMRKSARSS